jgi:hypothetical protein
VISSLITTIMASSHPFNVQRLPCDPVATVGDQVKNPLGDVFRHADARNKDVTYPLGDLVLGESLSRLGCVHDLGRDAVDQHLRRPLHGQSAG